jgi:uncharacterized protein with PIN domain
MVSATFRFYDGLNDFLARERRGAAFGTPCARDATTKHMIEALGVPHTEVELILVNGESSALERILEEGDRVAVYPRFTRLDVAPLLRLPQQPPGRLRFIADAHLGGLARLLRMAGFDTIYRNTADDGLEAGRIVLTRDRERLKRREVEFGCYVRALHPQEQLHEVFDRYSLAERARPFTLCLHCNAPLRGVPKAEVLERLPSAVRTSQETFTVCDCCGRVFWQGSHWKRMAGMLAAAMDDDQLLAPEGDN